jgi:hypothetical protein
MVVLMQFGLLALVIAIMVANAIARLPMTLDSSQWYAGRSWIVMLCLLGLIVHGFRFSMAGHPLGKGTRELTSS